MSPSGQPYVGYEDFGNSYKVTVMKYDSVYTAIDELSESRLSLYPNPATDKITIVSIATPIQSQLSIMNLNGKELTTRQITQPQTQIDISNLPSGVYFVRLTSDRTVEMGKIIKQ
jgi:Secretion system C-terminal sorting domain